jgi:hypothetical protein
MRKPRSRARGVVRQVVDSGLFDAYRLDAAAVVALSLIGVSVHRLSPDLLWAYAGVVLLLTVWAVGKTSAVKPPQSRTD